MVLIAGLGLCWWLVWVYDLCLWIFWQSSYEMGCLKYSNH